MGQRQLRVLSRLDHNGLVYVKQKVTATSEKAKRILSLWEQQRFLDWEPGQNEVLVSTDYSDYAALIPASCSKISSRSTNVCIQVGYRITHAVFRVGNSYFPCSEIELGHTYLCVLRFGSEIPELVKQLPVFGDDRLPNALDLSLLLIP